MSTQSIASALKYDGDAIAQLFFDTLTDANFHTEVEVLHAAYEAMQWTPESASREQMIENVISAIRKLEV